MPTLGVYQLGYLVFVAKPGSAAQHPREPDVASAALRQRGLRGTLGAEPDKVYNFLVKQ